MPRVVDHAERRQNIVAAVWRLAAAGRSLDRVTFRAVAAEMGASTTTVTHYFANRDALLEAAFEPIRTGFQQALTLAEAEPPEEGLRRVLRDCLPGTDPYYLAYIAFAASPEFAGRVGEDLERMHGLVTVQVRQLWPQTPSPADLARAVLAMADGIAMEALWMPDLWPLERQEAVLAAGLEAMGLGSADIS